MALARLKEITCRLSSSGSWEIYKNSLIPSEAGFVAETGESVRFDKYKMHISLSPEAFIQHEEGIKAILILALEQKVISKFKIYRVNFVLERAQKGTREIDRRQLESPFVIYLHNKFKAENAAQVLVMCQEIENLLKGTRLSREYYAGADVPINNTHFLIRQTALQGNEYRPADDAQAELLKAEVLKSEYCAVFATGLKGVVSDVKSAAEAGKVEAKATPHVSKFFVPAADVSLQPADQPKKKGWLSCLCG